MSEQPQVVISPDRMNLFVAVLLFLMILVLGSTLPLPVYLLFLALPVVFFLWVLRTKTTVDARGITASPAFRAQSTVAWEDLAGVGFQGTKAFAQRHDGTKVALPAVSFNSLPLLEEASAGRIPDALGQGRAAVDEKVRVVNRDGEEVLMTESEYEEYARMRVAEHERQQQAATQKAQNTPQD